MKNKIMLIIHKFMNKETIMYLIFGILTTLINIAVFWLAEKELLLILDKEAAALVGNIIAWIISVAFAFITNKLFVFESKSFRLPLLIKEMTAFVAARLLSLAFDEGFMYVAIQFMDSVVAKVISNVFVVVINYIFSKLFIFKKK